MKTSVFEYKHYRDYLHDRLSTTGATRGLRSRLAELTHTQPAFITRVLNEDMHMSLEHVPPVNELLRQYERCARCSNVH